MSAETTIEGRPKVLLGARLLVSTKKRLNHTVAASLPQGKNWVKRLVKWINRKKSSVI